MAKKKRDVKAAAARVETPVGVIIFSALVAFMQLLPVTVGIEWIQTGLDRGESAALHPLLLLGLGLFGWVAALRFLLLRRDGWVLILIAAVLLMSPLAWFPNGTFIGYSAISLALLVYLFTPAVKQLYRIEGGPTL